MEIQLTKLTSLVQYLKFQYFALFLKRNLTKSTFLINQAKSRFVKFFKQKLDEVKSTLWHPIIGLTQVYKLFQKLRYEWLLSDLFNFLYLIMLSDEKSIFNNVMNFHQMCFQICFRRRFNATNCADFAAFQ